MTRVLVAEFAQADNFVAALRQLKSARCAALDIMTPYAMPDAAELIEGRDPPVRAIMAAFGFGMAILAYALEWFSAAINYPIDSGGRPFNSWPVFWLMPFEVGVLAAAISGFVVLLVSGGLPRLSHPIFSCPGIEGGSQDRFFVICGRADDDGQKLGILFGAGASSIAECET